MRLKNFVKLFAGVCQKTSQVNIRLCYVLKETLLQKHDKT